MIIPIRCFTCGRLVADKWEEFQERTKKGEEPKKVLDDLKLNRFCCRRMLITHIELIENISIFSQFG
ncbi:MAG: DNA-directed RNA polymerase subunit N [Candidatus Lokiarchaeota archaeon]|nr:DNA-directed RNA polymerase subunit N [Candidatus Lokiarchaeota archaeon]